MARELIRLEGVHRSFGPTTVLEGVNVRIEEGDRIGIVGHNGAGKTTTLAKIAVTERMHGRKVALVTMDTYKIGGVEQLDIYADALKESLHICKEWLYPC